MKNNQNNNKKLKIIDFKTFILRIRSLRLEVYI